jgi:flagellar protein FlaG
MVSEISKMASGGAGVAAARPAAPAPAPASSQAPGSSAIQIPDTPKVQAPKPVAIKFDASEVRQNLQEAVRMLNQQMSSTKRGLGFQVDEAVGGPVVTVRSADSGEVIRQIPNEVVVRVAHNIEKIKGLLFSANA